MIRGDRTDQTKLPDQNAVPNCVASPHRIAPETVVALGFFVLLVVAPVLHVSAQEFTPAWVRHYITGDDPSNDVAAAVAVSAEGDAYVAATRDRRPYGKAVQLLKISPGGNVLWEASYEEPPRSQALQVRVDGAGNPHVLAKSWFADGSLAAIVLKFRQDSGELLWSHRVAGAGSPSNLEVDVNGDVFLSTHAWSEGVYSAKLYMLMPDGVESWSHDLGQEYLADIEPDGDGGIFAVTWQISSNHKVSVTRYRRTGEVRWSSPVEMPQAIAFPSRLIFSERLSLVGSSGGLFLARLDPANGKVIDVSRHTEGDRAAAAAAGPDESVYVTGYDMVSRFCKDECPDDFITAKFDAEGGVAWSVRHDDGRQTGSEYPVAIIPDLHGKIIVSGVSSGTTTVAYDAADGKEIWKTNNPDAHSPVLGRFPDGDVVVAESFLQNRLDVSVKRLDTDVASFEWTTMYDGPLVSRHELTAIAVDQHGSTLLAETYPGRDSCSLISFTGSGELAWSRTILDSYEKCAVRRLHAYPGGGFVAAGEVSRDGSDWMAAVLDGAGAVRWSRTYDGTHGGDDELSLLHVRPDGDLLLAGRSGTAERREVVVIRSSEADGRELWRTRFAPTDGYDAYARDLFSDQQGDVFLLGSVEAGIAYGEILVAKIEGSTGRILWEDHFGGTGSKSDHPVGLARGADGSAYVVAELRDSLSGRFTTPRNILVRYSTDGFVEWERQLGTQKPVSAASDGEGNAYVVSISLQSRGPFGSGGGDLIYTLRKFDPSGELLWTSERNTGIGSFMDPPSVRIQGSQIWLVGSIQQIADQPRVASVLAYRSDGELERISGLYPHVYPKFFLRGFGLDQSGNLYGAGSVDGALTVLKFAGMGTQVDVEEEPPREFSMGPAYPNPAVDNVMIPFHLPAATPVELHVTDVLGRRVLRKSLKGNPAGPGSISLEVSGLAAGLYFYTLTAAPHRRSGSIVVHR